MITHIHAIRKKCFTFFTGCYEAAIQMDEAPDAVAGGEGCEAFLWKVGRRGRQGRIMRGIMAFVA